MIERPQADQVALERLFPDEEKRKLAGEFIEAASRLANVSRIVTYDLDGKQRIMVISYGDTSPDVLNDRITEIYERFSNHKHFSEVLGLPNVVSELQFKDLVLCDPEASADEIIDLWDRKRTIAQVAA